MIVKDKKLSFKKLINSFKYAFKGIGHAFKYEQNFKIHSMFIIIVVLMSVLFKISKMEWLFIIVIIGLVIATELINTAMEALVDLVTSKYKELAKVAKDTASAAVLILALTSVIIGLVIFIPKINALF